MIIQLCSDDGAILTIANLVRDNPGTSTIYRADRRSVRVRYLRGRPNTFTYTQPRQLEQNEDLYILAHGDGDGDVIGNLFGGGVSAVQLHEQLSSYNTHGGAGGEDFGQTTVNNLFPDGYEGRIYFVSCESLGFARDFHQASGYETYGFEHDMTLRLDSTVPIPLPSDHSWRSGTQ